jgi:hypothetical protein
VLGLGMTLSPASVFKLVHFKLKLDYIIINIVKNIILLLLLDEFLQVRCVSISRYDVAEIQEYVGARGTTSVG